MDILNKKQKIIIIVIATLMLLFIGFYIINKANNSEYIELETVENEVEDNTISNEETIEQEIIIHVTGAVKNQGIIKTNKGARIADIIEAAGGITNEADLSKINLAYEVEDGQKIYVPNINDEINVETVSQEAGGNIVEDDSTKTSKVNINTASQTELETLSGVGPSTALKIINYREENGEFNKIEDIKNVPGVGETKFENLKESICVK